MYNCRDYTRPVWQGNVMLHESFMPVEERRIQLLYKPDEIISVMNSAQTVTYKEGDDYMLRDGALYIPEGSEIKIMAMEEYNPAAGSGFTCKNGGFLKFAEGAEFHSLQYEVSYRHSDIWDSYIPSADKGRLPGTRKKLAEGKPFTLGYLGDSITTGANSSKIARKRTVCSRLAGK